MGGGITEKDATTRARREFMRSERAEIWVTETTEDVEIGIVRSAMKESFMRSGVAKTGGR